MRIVIYGSRPDGHARVVLDLLSSVEAFQVVGLIDDEPDNAGRRIGEFSVVGSRVEPPRLASEGVEGVLLGFGTSVGRGGVITAIHDAGLELPVLVHPSAHVSTSATLAAGAQVLLNASVGPGARIG